MANLIGQYIHYNIKNYYKWGLRRTDFGNGQQSSSSSSQIILNNHKDALKNDLQKYSYKYKEKDIEELEKKLNYFYAWKNAPQGSEEEKKRNLIIKTVEDVFNSKLKEGQYIEWNSLNISSSAFSDIYNRLDSATQEEIQKINKIHREDSKTVKHRVSTIENRYNLLMKMRKEISKEIQASENLLKIKSRMDELEKEWNNFEKSVKGEKQVEYLKAKNFIDEIDALLAEIKYNSNALKGTLSEFVLYCMNYGTLTQLKNVQKELWTMFKEEKEKTKTRKGVSYGFIDSKVVQEIGDIKGSTRHKIEKSFGLFTAHGTEEKIDIEIKLDSGNEIPISLKNYNLTKTINSNLHLLSGRSLLGLVQEYTTFINHYLNIVPKRDGGNENAQETIREDFHNVMRLTILLKAIRGGVYGINKSGNVEQSKMADFFIVNDSSAKDPKFEIYTFQEIYDYIEQNIALLKTGDPDDINKLTNTWSNTSSNARIANLLMQMHAMSLSVSIPKSSLKK